MKLANFTIFSPDALAVCHSVCYLVYWNAFPHFRISELLMFWILRLSIFMVCVGMILVVVTASSAHAQVTTPVPS